MEDGSEIFGAGRTWFEVQHFCMGVLQRKFRWVQSEHIEDAAAEAVLWGMTVWVHSPSSVRTDDPWLTYRGARWACSRKATELLVREIRATSSQAEIPDYTPDPLTEAASEVVEALQEDEREWTTWAKDYLEAGESEHCTAKKLGVAQSTIHRRRTSGMRRIQPLLRKHGLCAESR